MTVREIRVFGDPVLRERAAPVDPSAPSTAQLVEDLVDTVLLPGRAGVAACQIGVAAAAFSYNVDGDVGYILNPRIVELGDDRELVSEGCLSVPELTFDTRRSSYARVEGQLLDGSDVMLEGRGLMAQMLQHECGHLDGQLYIMTLEKEARRLAMHAIRQAPWY